MRPRRLGSEEVNIAPRNAEAFRDLAHGGSARARDNHFFGMDDLSGAYYGFWSGIGSDISEIAILGAVVGIYRKHNCHVKRCARIGKHVVAGTPYVVCAKHHPDVPDEVTFDYIRSVSAGQSADASS